MQINKYNTADEIKAQIRRGDYSLISEILKGRYTSRTVESQITGSRTLKQPVIDAANKLFASREALLAD